jgi:hypothetical protein
MKKACAAKVRLELEWNDARGACGRIATSLVDNQTTFSLDQSENLNKKLDIVRGLSDKLKRDLDFHLLVHGCAAGCYQQIATLLEHVAEKHRLIADLFDTLPDPQYAEKDEACADSERLFAHESARVAASIRVRLSPGSQVVKPRSFLSSFRIWFRQSFVPRFIRNFAHRVRCH